jgi:hypothetical protein
MRGFLQHTTQNAWAPLSAVLRPGYQEARMAESWAITGGGLLGQDR